MQSEGTNPTSRNRVALALGGGGACGLAHIGVLEILESEGIPIDCIVGSSMGGLVGALSAAGFRAREIRELARGFGFPRWFTLGCMIEWDTIFGSVLGALDGVTFETLRIPLLLTATDLEMGSQVVLRRGEVLPAVRATCAVPGVLPAISLDGKWLVDGGLVNLLPVDVAWMAHPDVVIAVNIRLTTPRRMPTLDWSNNPLLIRLSRFLPNPITARMSFEVLARAAEVTVARQAELTTAMTRPELLIEPELTDVGLRDFDRLDQASEEGRKAARLALPKLRHALETPPEKTRDAPFHNLSFDHVCGMVISPNRARATQRYAGTVYHFCSMNCADLFQRDPERYLATAPNHVIGG